MRRDGELLIVRVASDDAWDAPSLAMRDGESAAAALRRFLHATRAPAIELRGVSSRTYAEQNLSTVRCYVACDMPPESSWRPDTWPQQRWAPLHALADFVLVPHLQHALEQAARWSV